MEAREKRNLVLIGIFSAAFAFVEAMIVYYLRKLYYPDNSLFPLNIDIPSKVIYLEWVREFFTIVMLLVVALLVGKKFKDKFAYFIYGFAVWDIFYYIWLKVTLNWPSYLIEWDVLFLIPIIWISPWFVPVLISLGLIAYAVLLLNYPKTKVTRKEFIIVLISGAVFVISFIKDYTLMIFKHKGTQAELIEKIGSFIPTSYCWTLFILGFIFLGYAFYSFFRRARK
jgi:hypothetical protein